MNWLHPRTLLRSYWLIGLVCVARLPGVSAPAEVTSFSAFHSLDRTDPAISLPVRIEASVLYYDPVWKMLFMQDAGSGFYLNVPENGFPIKVGQRVRVEGFAEAGANEIELRRPRISALGENAMPEPRKPGFAALHGNRVPNQWVEVTGTIQWVQAAGELLHGSLTDGKIELGFYWRDPAPGDLRRWFGTRVRLRGAVSMTYENGRPVRATLLVPRREDFNVLVQPDLGPFGQPVQAIKTLTAPEAGSDTSFVHVQGVIDSQTSGASLRLHDDTGTINLHTSQPDVFKIGTLVEAIGNPIRTGTRVELANAGILTASNSGPSPSITAAQDLPDPNLPELTRISDIRSLSQEEAAKRYAVHITGVLTYQFRGWAEMFVQDQSAGIYVTLNGLQPEAEIGDSISVRGVTREGGFAPLLEATEVTRIAKGELPTAHLRSLTELRTGAFDSQWVEMVGVVRAAAMKDGMLEARLSEQSGSFALRMPETIDADSIRDAVVRMRGVVASTYNPNRELTGVELRVPSSGFLTIERPAPGDPFGIPISHIAELRQFKADARPTLPVKVRGIVTLTRPDGTFYLQEESRGLLVTPRQAGALLSGEVVEAVGYSEFHHSSGLLLDALVRSTGKGLPPLAKQVDAGNVISEENDQLWTTVRGEFQGLVHQGGNSVYTIQVGSWTLEASAPFSAGGASPAPPPGSVVGVDGVFVLERDLVGKVQRVRLEFSDPSLLRVIELPSAWTLSRLRTLITFLIVVLLIAIWRARVAIKTNARLRQEVEERKAVERDLAHKQFLVQALMENSPDLIYFKDREGRFVQVNQTLARKAGFSRPAIVAGMNNRDLYDEDTARTADEIEQNVIQTGRAVISRESREVACNGIVSWVQTTIVPHRDEHGEICGLIGIARDISGRKHAEESILREKQHYQIMFDAMPALVMYKDVCNRVLRINRFGASLLGLPADKIVGKSLFELDPGHADKSYEDDLEIARTGKPRLGVEEAAGGGDGRTVWLRTDKFPDRNELGQIAGVVVFAVDITQQKLAESALLQAQEGLEQRVRERTRSLKKEIAERETIERQLRAQELFVRTVIDTDPNMVFVKDRDGRYTLVNRASAAFSGLTIEDMIGRLTSDVFADPAVCAAIEANDQRIWATGCEQVVAEELLPNSQGQSRWFQSIKRPLRGERGEITHLLGVSADITDRKRREEELQRAQSFLNSVVQNLPITVFIKDAVDLRFVLWNKAGEELTGFTNAEMVGRSDHDFFSPEIAAQFIEKDREALRSRQVVDIPEEELESRHRGRRLMHTRKIPIFDDQGNPRYLLGIAEDITERKQAEEELRQARDAAEAANRAKSGFLANMSHEIRTPMNGVIGMTHLLLSSGLSAEQHDYAENVRRCAEGLLTVINDILDFSKIEAGKLHFEHLDFELQDVVDGSLDMVADAANGKSIELGALVAREIDGALRGDPGRLRQVLLNLLGNAIKFTQSGEVSLEVTQIDSSDRHLKLHFEVTDTGMGIPAETQTRLFQPFSQADASTTRKHGGTGLGLVISKQIVELMGGDMGVRSEPGKGSTFWFNVILERQPADSRGGRDRLKTLRQARILVVDDNGLNRRILDHNATNWGMMVTLASSGSEALARLRQAAIDQLPFDLAILDMQMPEMDGLMLADAIQSDPRIRSVALILLSSLGQTAPAAELRQRGITASLTKPVRQSDLYDCLATVLAGESGTTFRKRRQSPGVPEPSARPRSSIRVLVAEDNAVNQKVAVRTLEKLGYEADCVGNGQEALTAVESILYDVILMDCNMPEMDGYEATRAIRQLRQPSQPYIIAMTANAMVGDREKCLAAGMDDYLSKPLREQDLDHALTTFSGERRQTGLEVPLDSCVVAASDKSKSAVAPDLLARIDPEAIARLHELGEPGGPDLAIEFIDLYLTDARAMLQKIIQSQSANEVQTLRRQAHTLKGSSRNMGAESVAEIAARIEQEAETGDPGELAGLVRKLAGAFEATVPLLEGQKTTAPG